MAAAHNSFESAPRAYRPAYAYRYGPNFPPSASMTMFVEPVGEAWPSDHRPTPPATDFPIDLATHRRQRAAEIANNINRRRTDTAFPRPELGHSAPTVANSRLTASVSGNDISQPTPKPQRLRFPNLRRDNTPTGSKPSRIPTPVHGKTAEGESGRRYLSTPVLPSQKIKKENVPPKPLRLLGPISPTRQQSSIPKSRTMGMLSSLTSSFSRSNLSLSSTRQASASSARTSDPTISVATTSSPPLPTFTTNIRQVHTAQITSYWCGRFQALSDRFQTESMQQALDDPTIMARYVPTIPESPSMTNSLSNITNIANNSRYQPQPKGKPKTFYDRMVEFEQKSTEEIVRLMREEEEKRNKKVLLHLEALCVTNEAKKSLWEWQLAYARTARNEKYLPQGGRMVGQEKSGWVSRMGRMVSGGMSASGSLSSLGRRSGLGALGRRKASAMGLGHAQSQRQRGYETLGEVY